MTKHNLSAFEENILRAFNDTVPHGYSELTWSAGILRKEDNLDEMANKVYYLLISRGQMPDQIREDYIKKVLEHFLEQNIIGENHK